MMHDYQWLFKQLQRVADLTLQVLSIVRLHGESGLANLLLLFFLLFSFIIKESFFFGRFSSFIFFYYFLYSINILHKNCKQAM